MVTKSKRPHYPKQLAKLIADIATGEMVEIKTDDGKDLAAVGRKSGLTGGNALSPTRYGRQSAELWILHEIGSREGFFGLLKRERIYRIQYPTLDAARADVFEYIERRHNPRMRRRTAGQDLKFSTGLTPILRHFGPSR